MYRDLCVLHRRKSIRLIDRYRVLRIFYPRSLETRNSRCLHTRNDVTHASLYTKSVNVFVSPLTDVGSESADGTVRYARASASSVPFWRSCPPRIHYPGRSISEGSSREINEPQLTNGWPADASRLRHTCATRARYFHVCAF